MARKKQEFQWLDEYMVYWDGRESQYLRNHEAEGIQWFRTDKEAADFIHAHLLEFSKRTVPPAILTAPGTANLIRTFVVDSWEVIGGHSKPITARTLLQRFRKSESGTFAINGECYIGDTWHCSIYARIFGKEKIEAYLQSDEMQELSKIMASIGAQGAISGGVFVPASK